MSVTLPDVEYARMMWALREIACGYKMNPQGFSQRLSRDELRLTAARTCDHFGWSHSLKDIQRLEGMSA